MKLFTYYFIIIIVLVAQSIAPCNIIAGKPSETAQAKEHFRRLIESAHPTPNKNAKVHWLLPVDHNAKLPRFLNVNTIDSEEEQQYRMQNESSIAVNPKNPKNLIASAVDYRSQSSTWVYVSHDGGKTWENINLGKPFPHWNSTNDPSVMFDAEGVGYLNYGAMSADTSYQYSGENAVLIAKTTDEGRTWKAHIPVIWHLGHQTLDSVMEDKYYIQVDNSTTSPYYRHLYTPWKRVTPRDSATQIVISKSTDLGETWSEPVNISHRLSGTSEDTTFGQSFPLSVTGPNGELYVVWNHGIVHGVGFAKSLDGGKTFTEPRIIHHYEKFGQTIFIENQGWRHGVKGKVRAEAYPSMVCDITNGPRRGWLYLTWSAGNPPDVFFSRSTDGGETWSTPVVVHSETKNDQFWEWISLDPLNGDIAIMYLDSRNDEANLMVDCFVSYSSDGGITWIDRRASDVSGDLRLNPFTGNSFAGDYSGCAFYDGKIYPSWIDMRSSATNIFDSDVYTAVVCTNAPEPPDPFKTVILPEEADKIQLQWTKPTTKAFGQPLADNEFSYKLFRNDVLIATLPGVVESYEDIGLTPYEEYLYSIYTFTDSDSSLPVFTKGYAGGAKQPMPPLFEGFGLIDALRIELYYKTPSLRADSVTPLVNFHGLELYRDRLPHLKFYFTPEDTAKSVILTDLPETKGYYHYFSVAFDSSGNNPPEFNKSEPSQDMVLFAGEITETYSDNFDELPMQKYYNSGNWRLSNDFYHSAPNAITHTPDNQYANRQNDTMWIFPVRIEFNQKRRLSFWHAAMTKKGDSCNVEVSFNFGNSWKLLATYDETKHQPWADSEVNDDDWKFEEMYIENDFEHNDIAIVRFRFAADVFRTSTGWYIDDVVIDKSTGVEESANVAAKPRIYPNPAVNFINVESSEGKAIKSVKIIDLLGNIIPENNFKISKTNNGMLLNVSQMAQGIYSIITGFDDGSVSIERIIIIR